MALNLGDITFGMEADTAGLQKSLDKLQRFGREVDKVARSQQKGAQTAVAAMARQESAIKSALRQTINLRDALRKAGAPPQELARTTNAFRRLTNTMTKGKVSILQFTRAQDAFRASTNKSQRTLKGFTNAAGKGKKGTSSFSKVLRDLESSAVLAVGPLSGVGARIRSIGAIAGRSSLKIVALLAGIVALTVGMVKLASGAISASRELQRINTRLKVATGSTIAAAIEFEFITKTARKLGLNLASTAKQYALFAASTRNTNIEGVKTREIFLGVASAARALSLSADDTAGIFKAITQIMSKGTVQAEELRGQMGERIPGAFKLASEAMGVTTQALNKLLKDGKVLSDDFLPKFAKVLTDTFGLAALSAAEKLEASIENLATSTFLFSIALDKTTGISKKFQTVVDNTARFVDFLAANMKNAAGVLGALGGAFIALSAPIIFTGIVTLISLMKGLAVSVAAVNLALLFNPLVLIGTALVGAAAGFLLFRDSTDSAVKETKVFLNETQKVLDLLNDTDTAVLRSAKSFIEAIELKIEARKADLTNQQEILRKSIKLLALEQILPGPIGTLFGKGVQILGKDFQTAGKAVQEMNGLIDGLLSRLDAFQKVQAKLDPEKGLISDKARAAILDTQKGIDRLTAKILAMAEGTKALKILEDVFDREDQIEKMVKALKRAGVAQETINEKVREFGRVLTTFDEAEKKFKFVQDRLKELDRVGTNAMKSIEDGIIGVIDGTKTLGEAFSNMIDNMLRDLTRFFLRSAFAQPGGGSFITDLFKALLPAVAPTTTPPVPTVKPPTPRVHGGPVGPGRSFVVGENRPEIFRPTSAGRIIPNANMGGPTEVNVTVINNATGTEATVKESAVGNTRNIEIMIDDLVASKINNPSSRTSRALRTSLSQGVIRR